MPTLFTRIIDGEIPGTFVWKDALCVAFMSIDPINKGHVLVVPRMEVDYWIDCPPEVRDHVFSVSQVISEAIQKAFSPTRVGLIIAGLEVPHMHVHLVPFIDESDLDFSNAARGTSREELEDAADSIRYVLKGAGATGVSD